MFECQELITDSYLENIHKRKVLPFTYSNSNKTTQKLSIINSMASQPEKIKKETLAQYRHYTKISRREYSFRAGSLKRKTCCNRRKKQTKMHLRGQTQFSKYGQLEEKLTNRLKRIQIIFHENSRIIRNCIGKLRLVEEFRFL